MEILKKIKMLGDVSTFSLAQCSSDPNGKSSFMPILGVITILSGVVMFIFHGIIKNLSLVEQDVIMVGVGSTLLGVRKWMNGKPILQDTVSDTDTADTKDGSDVSSDPAGPDNLDK